MNWLDLFGESGPLEVSFSDPNYYALDGRCEDDKTVISPYLDVTPAESNKEDGSPLKF